MADPTLFDQCRSTDPDTSRMAAAKAAAANACQRESCRLAVNRAPGLTAAEIAAECRLERHVPSRRLPELRAAGKVVSGSPRVCRVTHSLSLTWWPAEKRS